jgi:Arginine dihydrolase ArgZ-like, C-terminal, Rossmann fold
LARIDLSKVKTHSIARRRNRVNVRHFARPVPGQASFEEFWDSLPKVLASEDLRSLAQAIAQARRKGKPVIAMMGAHVVKCGLSPVLIDLMERGILTAIAMNGAVAVHDCEIALFGATSEEVSRGLRDGSFGMARETGEFFNRAVSEAARKGKGLGKTLGESLIRAQAKNRSLSLLAEACRLGIPATVHVAIGTDIVHQHPSTDGGATGKASFKDFLIFAGAVAELGPGSVVLNLGSAVILPEVFLKALTVARNLKYRAKGFVTANFDMIQHYRAKVNVVQRPTEDGGKGYAFTGHHELTIPLLAAAVKTVLEP